MDLHRISAKLHDWGERGWYAVFNHPYRKRKWRSLSTKDETAARQKLTRLERLASMGEYDPWNQKPDIGQLHVHEAARRFVRSCERDGLAEQTIEHYRTVLRIFRKSLPPGLMLRAVKAKHVRHFLNHDRDLADESKRTYLRALTTFFNWCIEQGQLRDNPAPDPPRGDKGRKETAHAFLTRETKGRGRGRSCPESCASRRSATKATSAGRIFSQTL